MSYRDRRNELVSYMATIGASAQTIHPPTHLTVSSSFSNLSVSNPFSSNGKDKNLEGVQAIAHSLPPSRQSQSSTSLTQLFSTNVPSTNRSSNSAIIISAEKLYCQIYASSSSVEKLCEMAKKKSLFDDQSDQFSASSDSMRLELSHIYTELQTFEATTKALRTAKNISRDNIEHFSSMARCLASFYLRTYQQFCDAIASHLHVQKSRKERGEKLPYSSAPLRVETNHKFPQYKNPLKGPSSDKTMLNMEAGVVQESDAGLIHRKASSQQLQLFMEEDHDDLITENRNKAVRQVLDTLNDFGDMVKHITLMIAQQGEQVGRIQANIDTADVYVERGYKELLKIMRNIQDNRWFTVKVFLVVFVFLIIYFLVT